MTKSKEEKNTILIALRSTLGSQKSFISIYIFAGPKGDRPTVGLSIFSHRCIQLFVSCTAIIYRTPTIFTDSELLWGVKGNEVIYIQVFKSGPGPCKPPIKRLIGVPIRGAPDYPNPPIGVPKYSFFLSFRKEMPGPFWIN